MNVRISLPLYTAIYLAQKKYRRVYGRDLQRIDVLVEPETYNHICKIQRAFAQSSQANGNPVLTMSEILRIILNYALEENAQMIDIK